MRARVRLQGRAKVKGGREGGRAVGEVVRPQEAWGRKGGERQPGEGGRAVGGGREDYREVVRPQEPWGREGGKGLENGKREGRRWVGRWRGMESLRVGRVEAHRIL